jgi:hypothetical protein
MKNVSTTYRTSLYIAFVVLLAIVLLVGMPEMLTAQPGLPDDPSQTPIDGGLGILAALGGAYGIKKLREKE